MNVQLPNHVRVKHKTDLHVVNEIRPLLERSGFRLARFEEMVSFFRSSKMTNGEVPIQFFYQMGRKEFQVFIEVLSKLDNQNETVPDLLISA